MGDAVGSKQPDMGGRDPLAAPQQAGSGFHLASAGAYILSGFGRKAQLPLPVYYGNSLLLDHTVGSLWQLISGQYGHGVAGQQSFSGILKRQRQRFVQVGAAQGITVHRTAVKGRLG